MRPADPIARPARRGNYTMMLAVALMVVLGFGALAVDVSYVLMARSQAQAVADAASQAGTIVLRQTGDRIRARDAAERVVQLNPVAGRPAQLDDLVFGTWDDLQQPPVFYPNTLHPNAAHAVVAREGGQAISFLLARIWGWDRFAVRGEATSAARSIQVALVLDVTGSWGERDFGHAREAMLTALDMLTRTASGVDEVSMTIFTNRYAWVYTPFTNLTVPEAPAAVRAQWDQLNLASKGGRNADPFDGIDCSVHPGPGANDFTSPPGGCYPQMPREYFDESGTDHSTGILLAKQLFEERGGDAAYRAMIVLTDGRPNELGPTSGATRAAQGFQETRWREYVGPVPRSTDAIRDASIAATADLWNGMDVNTWVVSLVADDWMMPAMARGDGYAVRTDDADRLAAILAQIVSEMPIAIVE